MKYLRAVGFFLGTLGIYLAPPLVGWGIGDLRGFFSFYPRLGYAVLVAALGLAAGYQAIVAPEGIRGGKGEKGKLVRRHSVVKVVVILSMYGALIFLPFADRHGLTFIRNLLGGELWVLIRLPINHAPGKSAAC